MAKIINVGGRLHSTEVGNTLTGANEILDDVKGKKQNVINSEVSDELTRLEQSKQDNLTFDNTPTEDSTNPVTSGGVYNANLTLHGLIEAILVLIPSAATALNQLADKNFVNSSIATDTATFRGTSAVGLTEQQFLDWANSLTHDMNDYVFWQTVDAAGNTLFKRYKWDGTQWLYEYTLNNSSFTADQWAAIMSGITAGLVEKLRNLPTAAELIASFDTKQDVLTFDNEPTQGSNNPVKSGGIYSAIKTVDDAVGAIEALIPAAATDQNLLADMAYVLTKILDYIPACKGQFETLVELQNVQTPKAGDMGIVRTKDSDGYDVLTFYQYLNNQWNVYYTLSRHPQTKPATTGTTGDYPFNGMGRVELAKNMVNIGTDLEPVMVNTLTQDMFYKGAVGSRVPNTNTIYVIQYDFTLGEDITVPANCVLEFDGGSISGAYTITGADTGIISGLVKVFNTDVIFAGTWNIDALFPEWFGAKGDGVTDDTTILNHVLSLTDFAVSLGNKKTYIVSDTINVYCDFNGNNSTIKIAASNIEYSVLKIYGGTYQKKQVIKDIRLIGARDETLGDASLKATGIDVVSAHVLLSNCNVMLFKFGIVLRSYCISVFNCSSVQSYHNLIMTATSELLNDINVIGGNYSTPRSNCAIWVGYNGTNNVYQGNRILLQGFAYDGGTLKVDCVRNICIDSLYSENNVHNYNIEINTVYSNMVRGITIRNCYLKGGNYGIKVNYETIGLSVIDNIFAQIVYCLVYIRRISKIEYKNNTNINGVPIIVHTAAENTAVLNYLHNLVNYYQSLRENLPSLPSAGRVLEGTFVIDSNAQKTYVYYGYGFIPVSPVENISLTREGDGKLFYASASDIVKLNGGEYVTVNGASNAIMWVDYENNSIYLTGSPATASTYTLSQVGGTVAEL